MTTGSSPPEGTADPSIVPAEPEDGADSGDGTPAGPEAGAPPDGGARITASIVSPAAGGPHALVERTWIEVIAGPEARTIVDATGGRVVVGTHPSAEVVLSDRTVSRFHCEIVTEAGGRVVVRDLG